MRSRHGRAAGKRITTVAGIVTRARVCARRSDVRLDTVASISCDWATATEGCNGITTGIQRSGGVGRRIK